jgi:hypothetical protein
MSPSEVRLLTKYFGRFASATAAAASRPAAGAGATRAAPSADRAWRRSTGRASGSGVGLSAPATEGVFMEAGRR